MLLLALTMVYFMFGSIKYFKFSKTCIASNCMYLDKMASRNNQDERRNYCWLNMFILDFWLNPAENTVWYINMKWKLFNKRFKKSDNYIDLSCTMFVSSCKTIESLTPSNAYYRSEFQGACRQRSIAYFIDKNCWKWWILWLNMWPQRASTSSGIVLEIMMTILPW